MQVLTDLPWYQQGSAIIEPIDEFPEAKLEPIEDRCLSHGENGHQHIAVNPLVTLFMVDQLTKVMEVPEGGTDIECEVHGPMKNLPAGKYRVTTVNEEDHFAKQTHKVID